MPLCLCSLLAAISQFWVSIGQKIQLTGYENANNMRNAKCVDTQNSMEWPYCSFLYCDQVLQRRVITPLKTLQNYVYPGGDHKHNIRDLAVTSNKIHGCIFSKKTKQYTINGKKFYFNISLVCLLPVSISALIYIIPV